jgi:hypothetical protein
MATELADQSLASVAMHSDLDASRGRMDGPGAVLVVGVDAGGDARADEDASVGSGCCGGGGGAAVAVAGIGDDAAACVGNPIPSTVRESTRLWFGQQLRIGGSVGIAARARVLL